MAGLGQGLMLPSPPRPSQHESRRRYDKPGESPQQAAHLRHTQRDESPRRALNVARLPRGGIINTAPEKWEHMAYLATIKKHGAAFEPLTGGSMMSFLWGYDFGAGAFCSAYGVFAPQVPIAFYKHLVEGRRAEARAIVKDHEEALMNDLSGIGWAGLRAALVFMGFHKSWQERYPHATLTDEAAARVKAYMVAQGLL